MNNYEKLKNHFSNNCINRGGLVFFKKAKLPEVIDYCEKCGFKIWGFDSFVITECVTQPEQDYSIDFSDTSGFNYKESRKFIINLPEFYLYSITID